MPQPSITKLYGTEILGENIWLISDESRHLFPDWSGEIHIACQSPIVAELQLWCTSSFLWRGSVRGGQGGRGQWVVYLLYLTLFCSFLLCLPVFTALPSYSSSTLGVKPLFQLKLKEHQRAPGGMLDKAMKTQLELCAESNTGWTG